MEHEKYEALVEEALGIKRRTRRDQARLMILIKQAEDGDVLEKFCGDINLSVPAAKNYLAAHTAFLALGIVPNSGDGVSTLVQEMWEDVFDPTLHDARYGTVDREGVDAAADELGLRGSTKAYDIAKNPNSMKAAILGDGRAASAALDALAALAERDPLMRDALRDRVRRFTGGRDDYHHHHEFRTVDDTCRDKLRHLDQDAQAFSLYEVPERMKGFAAGRLGEIVQRLENKRTELDVNVPDDIGGLVT